MPKSASSVAKAEGRSSKSANQISPSPNLLDEHTRNTMGTLRVQAHLNFVDLDETSRLRGLEGSVRQAIKPRDEFAGNRREKCFVGD